MRWIGIDPGLTGALAVVEDPGVLKDVCPMPSMSGRVVPVVLKQILETWSEDTEQLLVLIEDVHSMPGQGVASTFKFGQAYGTAIGVVGAMGLPMDFVTPQKWKRLFTLTGKDKDASRAKATELWPSMRQHWSRKSDNGMSDAALIAEYGRRTL